MYLYSLKTFSATILFVLKYCHRTVIKSSLFLFVHKFDCCIKWVLTIIQFEFGNSINLIRITKYYCERKPIILLTLRIYFSRITNIEIYCQNHWISRNCNSRPTSTDITLVCTIRGKRNSQFSKASLEQTNTVRQMSNKVRSTVP